jgi:hypothetical protein
MIHLIDVANHEAGHAVIAAHLRLPFSHVWIAKGDALPEGETRAGAIEGLVFDFSFKMFRKTHDAFGEIIFVEHDKEAKLRELVEKHIVVICAGKTTNEMFGWRTTSFNSSEAATEDEEGIRELQDIHAGDLHAEISDERVGQLRRRVERLVRIPHIKSAIQETASLLGLSESRSLPANEVRSIYQSARRRWPKGRVA